jgi:hypothetical protein
MVQTLDGVTDLQKIDSYATDGLNGVYNSLAYRVNEIERHAHHYMRSYGLAAVPAGTTHRADEITSDPEPFVIDAGNDTWGAWVCVFGSTDTPAGWAYFDPGEVNIVAAENANVIYLIQMGAGASGAAALTAGTFSDTVFTPQSVNGRPAAMEFPMRRQIAGTLLWMRTLCRGTNTSELDLYIDLHGYEG